MALFLFHKKIKGCLSLVDNPQYVPTTFIVVFSQKDKRRYLLCPSPIATVNLATKKFSRRTSLKMARKFFQKEPDFLDSVSKLNRLRMKARLITLLFTFVKVFKSIQKTMLV